MVVEALVAALNLNVHHKILLYSRHFGSGFRIRWDFGMAALNKGGKGYKGYERLPHMWRVVHKDGVLVRDGQGQNSAEIKRLRHGEVVFPAGTVVNVPWLLYRWDAMKQERVVTGWTTMPRLCIWLGGGEEQIKG